MYRMRLSCWNESQAEHLRKTIMGHVSFRVEEETIPDKGSPHASIHFHINQPLQDREKDTVLKMAARCNMRMVVYIGKQQVEEYRYRIGVVMHNWNFETKEVRKDDLIGFGDISFSDEAP